AFSAPDPWQKTINKLHGRPDPLGGVERLSSQEVMARLQVPIQHRNCRSFLRASKLMKAAGWRPAKVLDARGRQSRGWWRRLQTTDAFDEPVRPSERELIHAAGTLLKIARVPD